jgi:hypothetical protein
MNNSRLNGFLAPRKPLNQLLQLWPEVTGLKPGVNEKLNWFLN